MAISTLKVRVMGGGRLGVESWLLARIVKE